MNLAQKEAVIHALVDSLDVTRGDFYTDPGVCGGTATRPRFQAI